MLRLGDITVDAVHPASLARFWAAVLEGYAVAPYDEAELERLAAKGIEGPEDDPTVLVEPSGPGPRFFFQRAPAGAAGRGRVRLVLGCDRLADELDRLTGLRAEVVRSDERSAVLTDPEGGRFSLVCAHPRTPD